MGNVSEGKSDCWAVSYMPLFFLQMQSQQLQQADGAWPVEINWL